SGTSLTQEQIKLIKRFTSNITILYDGDAAGIKAALRGLEMMASEDVNVRVVLLPDGEDPDSFLHKKGSTALREFIRDSKKDFIQFKVELMMKDAGNDPLKRADVIKDVVNTLATIPDAIRRSVLTHECSRMLSVSEQVLTVEVNKIKRKQYNKETGATKFETEALHQPIEQTVDHTEQLFQKTADDYQERDIIRLLLDFGKEMMDEETTVAQYILAEVKEVPLTNASYRLMLHEIEAQMEAGNIPDHHFFIQQQDAELKRIAIEIISSPYSLSENWDKMHDIFVTQPDKNFRKDVVTSLNYFKMKKVLQMMNENLKELKAAAGKEEEEIHFQSIHNRLSDIKRQLGIKMGSVIVN
ncbi:MAG: toprim domain-containing protein, partial [Chitinophagales bacterium]|nr:toprim domain-containing protein [Chitinophagales bacterium]